MQAEQTGRRGRPGRGGTAIPVLLALFYLSFSSITHSQQGSKSRVPTANPAVQTTRQGNANGLAAKPSRARLADAYAHLPLSFEANRGQAPGAVQFLAHGQGFTLFLAGDEAVLALKKSEGACQSSVVSCQSKEAGVSGKWLVASRQPSVVSGQSAVGSQQSAVGSSQPLATGDARPRTTDQGQRTTNAFVRMKIVGADPAAVAAGAELLPGQVNYFIGNDPAKWRTHIPTYGQVAYRNIYPGVDLVYYGHAGQLEYDFRVNPGASPDAIRMALDGVSQVRLTAKGDLALSVPGGEVQLQKPVVYQVGPGGEKQFIDARFLLQSGQSQITNRKSQIEDRQSTVGFQLGRYDPGRVLVIDPTLSYSTFLGGAGADSAFGIALDANGDAYVTGQAYSTNFPVSSGALHSTSAGAPDVFVTEFNPEGSALIYSTYLGGSGSDSGAAIAVDSTGAAYVTGNTNSANFPVTPGVKQLFLGGGFDAFISKLAPGGATLVYSTLLGGKLDDYGYGIAVDSSGDVYVAGSTASNNFPLTKSAYQGTFGAGATDAFFTELNATATAPAIYSTYLGGSGADSASAIALDLSGNIYLTGQTESTNFPLSTTPYQKTLAGGTDAFVTEFSAVSAGASSLLGSTYFGGAANDAGNGIAVDSTDNIYVVGSTSSGNFPVFPTTTAVLQATNGGGQDAFVAKFNPGAGSLIYSTYLGGSGTDSATAIAVDSTGDALVTGNTQSSNLLGSAGNTSVTGAIQSVCATGVTSTGAPAACDDAFVASVDPAGDALNYGTFIGGGLHDQGNAIAVDAAGDAYVAGVTESTDFPVTAGAFQEACTQQTATPPCENAFVLEIGAAAAAVQVSPVVLPFGVEPLNPSPAPSQTVTLTNNSGASITFTAAPSVSGDGFAVSSTTCSTTAPLATGGFCTATVTFSPSSAGSHTGTLTFADSATGSPQTVSLAGAGVASVVTASPASLTFPAQTPTTSSAPQSVTLQNFGSAPLGITSIGFIGANTADFSQTNTCGSSVAGDASCVVSVTFTPAAAGTATATLVITDATGGTQNVSLSGSGVSQSVSLSAANLNFGSVVINTKTTSQSVVLTNTGDAAVSITSVTISGTNAADFTLSSKSPCSPSIGVGGTCTIPINFKPLASGSLSATLSIADNAPGSPQTVALAGQGSDFGVTSSPTNATVNPGQSATFTAAVMPIGGFNNEVTLTCEGEPTYGSCSVSPGAVTPDGTTAANATVTVTTLAPARLAPQSHRLLPPAALVKLRLFKLPAWVWLLAVLLGLMAAARGKRRPSWVLLGATLALALFWMGCSSNVASGPTVNGTPPGAYQVTITGASNGLSHSVTVTVNVNT